MRHHTRLLAVMLLRSLVYTVTATSQVPMENGSVVADADTDRLLVNDTTLSTSTANGSADAAALLSLLHGRSLVTCSAGFRVSGTSCVAWYAWFMLCARRVSERAVRATG